MNFEATYNSTTYIYWKTIFKNLKIERRYFYSFYCRYINQQTRHHLVKQLPNYRHISDRISSAPSAHDKHALDKRCMCSSQLMCSNIASKIQYVWTSLPWAPIRIDPQSPPKPKYPKKKIPICNTRPPTTSTFIKPENVEAWSSFTKYLNYSRLFTITIILLHLSAPLAYILYSSLFTLIFFTILTKTHFANSLNCAPVYSLHHQMQIPSNRWALVIGKYQEITMTAESNSSWLCKHSITSPM